MKKILIILAITVTQAFSFPTPVPKPAYTASEASELSLKYHSTKNDGSEMWKTSFIQKMHYTCYNHSPDLQLRYRKENKKEAAKKDQCWIYEEWGWLVTVVMGHDLSQSNAYFVRKSGKVELLWQTM